MLRTVKKERAEQDGSWLPAPVPGWRSWQQQVATDKSEVKRLRQMLSQAEQDVEVLNDRLVDARQAQADVRADMPPCLVGVNVLAISLRSSEMASSLDVDDVGAFGGSPRPPPRSQGVAPDGSP